MKAMSMNWFRSLLVSSLAVVLCACSTTSPTVKAVVLAPAQNLPRIGECSAKLTHNADGNVEPLLCTDGHVNVLAWDYYARIGDAPILRLGPGASEREIETTLCTVQDATVQQRLNEFTLVSAYNGWAFGSRPAQVLNGAGCSAVLPTAPS
jgi:hypothetical protein